jgi:ribonuclease P protein component
VLAASQRLRRRAEFTAAVRTGRRAGRGVLVVHLSLPGPSDRSARAGGAVRLPARAGFVVPRTVGPAVTRNRVRRRLRHLVRDRLGELPPGAVLVVRALPGAGGVTYAQLGQDLDAALAATRRPRRAEAAR